ncbi:MAG: transcriptional regulator [Candidatus Parabeggiatoa sp. nov. 3]|nr:MAG: transcriptional regulator [Gammaproteobacteria bacterium]RKZ65064.1 MAG: transcriptional regulator [Gammaproteobacteria bacterium]RKZ88782.1 MAG: transcriptional regulator [Gammaproteobacteria bacterium]
MIDDDIKMIKSSGNIFTDLGFDEVEASTLHIRSLLMLEIEHYIKRQAITQFEAARQLGITSSSVDDLLNGKLSLFTIDALVNMLARIGSHVEVVVIPPQQKAA